MQHTARAASLKRVHSARVLLFDGPCCESFLLDGRLKVAVMYPCQAHRYLIVLDVQYCTCTFASTLQYSSRARQRGSSKKTASAEGANIPPRPRHSHSLPCEHILPGLSPHSTYILPFHLPRPHRYCYSRPFFSCRISAVHSTPRSLRSVDSVLLLLTSIFMRYRFRFTPPLPLPVSSAPVPDMPPAPRSSC